MNEMNEALTKLFSVSIAIPDQRQVMLGLFVTLAFSMIMWGTYRIVNTEESYDVRFATTLLILALISTVLMDLIRSNIALSLGMLGSLSIIRFRTNVKDPRDMGFIFWSMAIGLSVATESYLLGAVFCLLLGSILILTRRKSTDGMDMMLIIRGSQTEGETIGQILDQTCEKAVVKAKNSLTDSFEYVYKIKVPLQNSDILIRRLFEQKGVDTVNLLSEKSSF